MIYFGYVFVITLGKGMAGINEIKQLLDDVKMELALNTKRIGDLLSKLNR